MDNQSSPPRDRWRYLAEALPVTPLESVLTTKRPRCLDGVNATAVAPPEPRDCTVTAFSLGPKTIDDVTAKVLGYPLGDYNASCKSQAPARSSFRLPTRRGKVQRTIYPSPPESDRSHFVVSQMLCAVT